MTTDDLVLFDLEPVRLPDEPATAVAPVGNPVDALIVVTDGACSGNPGPAGWAWVDQHGTWRSGGLMRGTNQVAELLAVLHAVRDHMHVRELTVEIDSAYAMKTYMEWMDPAARRGWTTQAGKPTSNVEVIMDMMRARNARRDAGLPPVRFVKVKGHAGGKYPMNDAAGVALDLHEPDRREPGVTAGVAGPHHVHDDLDVGGGLACLGGPPAARGRVHPLHVRLHRVGRVDLDGELADVHVVADGVQDGEELSDLVGAAHQATGAPGAVLVDPRPAGRAGVPGTDGA